MNMRQYTDTISSKPILLKDCVRDVIASFKDAGVAIFKLLCEVQSDYEMRQRMKHLDARMLDDIGKTRAEVDTEANKPIWYH